MTRRRRSNPIGYTDQAVNTATGLGTSKGREAYGAIERSGVTNSPQVCEEIFAGDALGARIVGLLPDEGTREGFDVETGEEDFDHAKLASQCEDLDLLGHLNDAATWGRLYGGGGLIMHGGGNLARPWPMGARVEALTSADRYTLARDTDSLGDTGQILRGQFVPEFYTYSDPDGGGSMRIHHSRVFRFLGARLPPRMRAALDGWGLSVLERPYRALVRLAEALGYAGEMMHTASVMVLSVDGFAKAIAQGGRSADEMREAVEEVFDSIDALHGYAIDAGHDLREVSRSFGGVSAVLDHFVADVVRSADGAPKTVLLGEQPGGLNAGATGEISAWHSVIHAWQNRTLTPPVSEILARIFASWQRSGDAAPDEFTVRWRDLSPPDSRRDAERDLIRAQSDQIYIGSGVYDPDDVRERQIASGELVPAAEKPEDPDPEAVAAAEEIEAAEMEADPEAEVEAEVEAEDPDAEDMPEDMPDDDAEDAPSDDGEGDEDEDGGEGEG